MCPFDEVFKLRHSFALVLRQVRIYVVVIRDSVRRTGETFGDSRVVILRCCVTDDAGVPNVRNAQIHDGFERTLVDVTEPSATILLLRSIVFARLVIVRKPTREELVNNRFIDHILFVCVFLYGIVLSSTMHGRFIRAPRCP